LDRVQSGAFGDLGRRHFLRGVAGAGAAVGAGGILAACSSNSSTSPSPGGSPVAKDQKPGGDLKVGLTGGSSSDTDDPHNGLTYMDTARLQALYSPLVQMDANAKPVNVLAESITPRTPGSSTEFVIKLRKGVTFHDGKSLTSADVIFSFQRIVNGKKSGTLGLGPIDIKGVKALDKYTVLVPMTRPFSGFVQNMAAFWYYLYIAPTGFDPKKPVGTGPFMYKSFTPGTRSFFVKNPHYFITGRPFVNSLTIVDFADTTSMQNALQTKVIDAAGLLQGSQVAALKNAGGINVVVSKAGSIIPFTMRVDKKPFNDVRVRQALRYVVDRPQLIDSALDGYGTVGNDVFSPFDPDFNHGLTRAADIPRAKSLLKQAGQTGLTVTLTTSPVATGTVSMATVLKQQAAQAEIKINLQTVQPGTFFTTGKYLEWPFAQDFYNYSPYLSQVAYSMLKSSPFNETHNDNTNYQNLYDEANKTDPKSDKHKQILFEMQNYDFNQGGYIIPAYIDSLDAYRDNLTGYTTARLGQPLANFTFENYSFTK
jgi:peptide/nickel transport system substrate-binding protein